MSSKDNWDIETHKTEHECDEHWELRRKFLLAHKEKFPEDELVCLAQVFSNVELLGCRYPEETMQLIADLGRDIVGQYREKQKNKLQRTFVKASDAASSKVKGHTAPTSAHKVQTEIKTARSSADLQADKVSVKRRKLQDLPFGDIVLIERPGDIPQNILASALNKSGGDLEWKFDRVNNSCKCSIFVNSKLLAEAMGLTQKLAKKDASVIGLQKLQKYYYTIKIKQNIHGGANVTTTTMLNDTSKEDSISDDNIGRKLMKLMGWTGGGLGKSQQGIVEPVTIKQQISRKGLGLKSSSCTTNDLKNKSKDIMRKYLAGDMKDDLIFSADFTNDERAIIHQVARQMGLKSNSYGPKKERTLVVSRKIDIRDLVEELKSLGGVTSKYELIEPTEL
ncbi:NF-kappa-B-repressing factor [Dufourea novaeangliae]|uniref:NF-kappa-B-repressing factor n=2 Tax=Dufourea novaeangliae TaxID=178035 RepID=A0A154PRB4_DUFNO|nr:NF-kappa-B-repressing factor [Dufourea novaeangliae]